MSNTPTMRAKLRINKIDGWENGEGETLTMSAVAKSEPYPENGEDENNTFARFTPSADLRITITNPDLIGKFEEGEEFYLDFTKAGSE